MGRHPFAGRYLGKGDMPIERAIAESRFAYSRDTSRTQMAPPPYTPLDGRGGSGGHGVCSSAPSMPMARKSGRPSPEAWIDALDALKAALVPCKTVPWHYHLPGTQQCPWCAIEQPTRTKLFGGIVKVATAAIADLETLWARYLALAEPGPPRPLPKPSEWVRPPAAAAGVAGAAACSSLPRRWSALFVADILWPLDLTQVMGRDRAAAGERQERSSPSSPRFGS